jgi:uncharacterized membrane protein
MNSVTESIDVNVPVRTAYNQWTQFEEFPRFMDNVERVAQKDDTTLHWVAKVAGREKQWDAKVTEQIPDERVAWTSIDGPRNAGVVTFHRLGEEQTRVTVQMEVEPEGPIETAGAALGILQAEVKEDLKRFKEFIESRGQETGAWRGQVEQTATR